MKLIIMMILFSSLVLYEGYDGDEANTTEQGKSNPPDSEKDNVVQFHKPVVCWPSAVFWIAHTPWGYYLGGLAGLLLWLIVEVWSKSCLATLQKKQAHQATVPLETKTEPEMDLEPPEEENNLPTHCTKPRSRCACGTQTADLESDEPPLETYEPPLKTQEELGRSQQHEITLYIDPWRRRPPASYNEPNLKNDSSSSYVPSSSSSSSVGSSLCLAHLKDLDMRHTPESPPATSDSAEAILSAPPVDEQDPSVFLERTDAVPDLAPGDSSAIKENVEDAPMRVLMFAEMMETLPPFPEENEPQPLTSFAQINILQSLQNDNNVVFVEKSLAICMGKVPPPRPPPAAQEEEGEGEVEKGKEEEEEPTKMSFKDQKPLQHTDKNIDHKPRQDASVRQDAPLQDLFFTISRTILRAPPEARPRAKLDPDSAPTAFKADLLPFSYALEMLGGDTRHFLEFHIKKKMIQNQFGMPTAVTMSLKAFHASASPLPNELVASARQTPKPKRALTGARQPRPLVSPHLEPAAGGANLVRIIPCRKDYSIIYSIDPEEIMRLDFHARVKMLEIKTGAFPDTVETSFLTFKLLSEMPLPKCINFGIKIQRPKLPALPFLPNEALCIIDLNIKQKCLVGTRRLSALDMKALISEELKDLEGDPMALLYGATSVPETCLKGAEASFEELRRTALDIREPQPGSFSGPGSTMTAPCTFKPSGPEDHTTKEGSEKQSIPRQVQFQEPVILDYKKQVPCPRHPTTPAPGSQGPSFPIPSPQAMTSSSSSSPLVTSGSSSSAMNSSSSENGTTKEMPKKPWMWHCQLGPRGSDPEARRETFHKPHPSQEAQFHKLEPCPEEKAPCSGLGEQPVASLSQEPSHLVCSQLVTKTSHSFDSRVPADDDPTKKLSKICVSREMLFREFSILDTFNKEKSRESLRELPKHPDSQVPPSSLSSTLVNTRKVSEVYLKYVASAHSARSVAPKPSQTPSKLLGTSAKEGSGPFGKDIRTEKVSGVGGKGIRTVREAKAEGKGAKPETGREEDDAKSCQEEDNGPIKRTSIFLELELKKQKLNLLLKKRLQAHLQPPQRAAIELNIDVDKEPDGKKAKRAAYEPESSDTKARGKRGRPFCYVCMPVDNTGSVVKTVCWSLPKWILEMNGNRVPQVARFEKRPKGSAPAAK